MKQTKSIRVIILK